MRKWLAYGLLLSFVVLNVPRSWVHDCHHGHKTEKTSSTHLDRGDCNICEYHPGPSTLTYSFNLLRLKPIKLPYVEGAASIVFKKHQEKLSLRGPPQA